MDSRQALLGAGVAPERICLDPGFGFGKTLAHNLALYRGIPAWASVAPVLVGVSRKSMLGAITGQPVERRLAASLAGALPPSCGCMMYRKPSRRWPSGPP